MLIFVTLCAYHLQSLGCAIPNDDEVAACKKFKGNHSDLSDVRVHCIAWVMLRVGGGVATTINTYEFAVSGFQLVTVALGLSMSYSSQAMCKAAQHFTVDARFCSQSNG